ncbi:hypothetical protein MPSEU_000289400 [Mayamaea pseudoterrestris]|nr:hypothetical protein MPSEU_000289400 [Mayamaea pseudoterrestris]
MKGSIDTDNQELPVVHLEQRKACSLVRLTMKVQSLLLLCTTCTCLINDLQVSAFVPSQQPLSRIKARQTSLAASIQNDIRDQDFRLADDQVNPIVRTGKGDKEKVINLHGIRCVLVSLLTCPIWAASMSLVAMMHKVNREFDENRDIYDKTGKVWSRTWLAMTDSYPSFSGNVSRIREPQGPCLYVANHASWLDIPIICTVLDPVFKFIAKAELEKLPCIGQQLKGGNHILIDRDDRRSQLKTFKNGIGWLRKGVPIMAFPEGRRSNDGRLMDFKGGLFSMAVKTKVPIIPITIGHANAVMPGNALFPVQVGRGKLHVHIHEAIDTEGKSDDELVRLVREAFLSTLPFNQHPGNDDENGPFFMPRMLRVETDSHSVHVNHATTNNHSDHAATAVVHDHHQVRVPFFIVSEKEEREIVSK